MKASPFYRDMKISRCGQCSVCVSLECWHVHFLVNLMWKLIQCISISLSLFLLSSPSSRFFQQDPLEFRLSELKKHFVVGDHVKVIAGRHEGETGLVVRIETNLAVLLSDLTLQEVHIRLWITYCV